MRRLLSLASVVVLILAISLGFAWAEDRRTDKSQLIIMTLNTEFMWDGEQPEEGQVSFSWKGSPSEAEDHMRGIAEIIIAANPDMVNLVEVENLEALQKLNSKFLQGRGYNAYLVKGKDTYTGQDMGLLTRIDPESMKRFDEKGQSGNVTKSVSKNYVALFVVGEQKLALIGIHFLARPLSEDRRLPREAQADAVLKTALQVAQQGYQVVVLGDFNDFDGDDCCRDHINSQPVSRVLTIIKGMSPDTQQDDLINAAKYCPQSIRYTAFWDQNSNDEVDRPHELSSIDHILIGPKLSSKVSVVEIPHNHDPRKVTDHFPVVVRLKLDETGTPQGGSIRIVSLLPNPAGNESLNEQVTLKNSSEQTVNLSGWKLRDRAGRIWALDADGSVGPNQEKTITRQSRPMALNNGGDTVDLIDAQGKIIQTITYGRVEEGETISVD